MLGEKLRRYGFWTLDYVNGGIVKKHYHDIKKNNGRRLLF